MRVPCGPLAFYLIRQSHQRIYRVAPDQGTLYYTHEGYARERERERGDDQYASTKHVAYELSR